MEEEMRCQECGHLTVEHRTGECVHIIATIGIWMCFCPGRPRVWTALKGPYYTSYAGKQEMADLTAFPEIPFPLRG